MSWSWRPLPTSLFYALVPLAFGVAALVAVYSEVISRLGPFAWNGFLVVITLSYLIGAPPMAATGYVVARMARRGLGLPAIALSSAGLGFLFGGAAAMLWVLVGLLEATPYLVLGIAVAAGTAGLASALILGLLSIRLHKREAGV